MSGPWLSSPQVLTKGLLQILTVSLKGWKTNFEMKHLVIPKTADIKQCYQAILDTHTCQKKLLQVHEMKSVKVVGLRKSLERS